MAKTRNGSEKTQCTATWAQLSNDLIQNAGKEQERATCGKEEYVENCIASLYYLRNVYVNKPISVRWGSDPRRGKRCTLNNIAGIRSRGTLAANKSSTKGRPSLMVLTLEVSAVLTAEYVPQASLHEP